MGNGGEAGSHRQGCHEGIRHKIGLLRILRIKPELKVNGGMGRIEGAQPRNEPAGPETTAHRETKGLLLAADDVVDVGLQAPEGRRRVLRTVSGPVAVSATPRPAL